MARKSSTPTAEEAKALFDQVGIDDDEGISLDGDEAAPSPEESDSLAGLAPDEDDPAFPAVSVLPGADGTFPGEARADVPAPEPLPRPAPPPPPKSEDEDFEDEAAPFRGTTERVLVAKFGGVAANRCVRLPFSVARAKMADIYEEVTDPDGTKRYIVPKERMI